MDEYILGLFRSREKAEKVLNTLRQRDFDNTEAGLFARHSQLREELDAHSQEEGTAKGAEAGAATGAAAGGLVGAVAGASLFLVPGIGQALAIGTTAAAIGTAAAGTGIGAAYGGFMGALLGYGVSEEEANFYAEAVKRGGILLVVDTIPKHADEITKLIREAGAVDVETQLEKWQSQGWERFDESTEPSENYPSL